MAKARLIKRKKRIRVEGVILLVFLLSMLLYSITKIGLASYNITLSNQRQSTGAEVEKAQDAINVLQSEVNELQERSRVLAMAEKDGIQTNQNNIYVVEDEKRE